MIANVEECTILFMRAYGKSRLSVVLGLLILSGLLELFGQQKANDFTKRVGIFDGKMSKLSGRSSTFNRLSPSSSRRISVEEWPAHFSPFGGKRFPMGSAKIIGRERVTSTRIDIETPLNDQIARENFQRADNQNLTKRDPAVNAVEFRDAYYARLNDRVDEWMNKVNNMSLQDINRYQFRRDRPNKPGFPVQRAGAAESGSSRSQAKLIGSGLPERDKKQTTSNEHYWMGPKKITTSRSSTFLSPSTTQKNRSATSSQDEGRRNFKTEPKPILGPKTIRVEVGAPE